MLICDLVQAYLDSEESGKVFSTILTTVSYKELSEMREILNREQHCCKEASGVHAIVSTAIVDEMVRRIRVEHGNELEAKELCEKIEYAKISELGKGRGKAHMEEFNQLLCLFKG